MASDGRRLRELELIKKHAIGRQEQLVELLNAEGYNVTQATVSRDINELNLKKIKENGVFKYIQPNTPFEQSPDKITSLFKQSVISVTVSLNIIVVKTLTGNANAVCAIIDKMQFEGVLGTVAGDDCLFVVTEPSYAEIIADRFIEYSK